MTRYDILRAIIEGAHLAIYASIKPGGIHRLRLGEEAEILASTVYAAVPMIGEAADIGEKVRKGDLAAPHAGIGRLLAKALREAWRWTTRRAAPDILVPSITNALILAYVDPDSVIREAGDLREALSIFMKGGGWRDIKEFMTALKAIGAEEMHTHLVDSGITYTHAVSEGLGLADAVHVLGSRWPGFRISDPLEHRVYEDVKHLIELYKKMHDGINAVIAFYIELIKPRLPQWAHKMIMEAEKNGYMATKEGGKILFRLDLELAKKGYRYDEYIPYLAGITQLAVYEGLRP